MASADECLEVHTSSDPHREKHIQAILKTIHSLEVGFEATGQAAATEGQQVPWKCQDFVDDSTTICEMAINEEFSFLQPATVEPRKERTNVTSCPEEELSELRPSQSAPSCCAVGVEHPRPSLDALAGTDRGPDSESLKRRMPRLSSHRLNLPTFDRIGNPAAEPSPLPVSAELLPLDNQRENPDEYIGPFSSAIGLTLSHIRKMEQFPFPSNGVRLPANQLKCGLVAELHSQLRKCKPVVKNPCRVLVRLLFGAFDIGQLDENSRSAVWRFHDMSVNPMLSQRQGMLGPDARRQLRSRPIKLHQPDDEKLTLFDDSVFVVVPSGVPSKGKRATKHASPPAKRTRRTTTRGRDQLEPTNQGVARQGIFNIRPNEIPRNKNKSTQKRHTRMSVGKKLNSASATAPVHLSTSQVLVGGVERDSGDQMSDGSRTSNSPPPTPLSGTSTVPVPFVVHPTSQSQRAKIQSLKRPGCSKPIRKTHNRTLWQKIAQLEYKSNMQSQQIRFLTRQLAILMGPRNHGQQSNCAVR